ncbi:hypothetical protein TRIUR3_21205 [Triticum urartu]|uniref:Uncharacterized protein n=1 Tax=Triticum urartu TaxID=4572 RepID=M7YEP8_TRIUA|nr:hypothetical protein TRIUR3_21205 [Triticum urartu]
MARVDMLQRELVKLREPQLVDMTITVIPIVVQLHYANNKVPIRSADTGDRRQICKWVLVAEA